MQATAFLSLIYFLSIFAYYSLGDALTIRVLTFIAPFLLANFTLGYGLVKVGKARLLPYVPLSLLFDSALQLAIFLETKIRFRKEHKWVKLVKGKYYHAGTEIRTD